MRNGRTEKRNKINYKMLHVSCCEFNFMLNEFHLQFFHSHFAEEVNGVHVLMLLTV